MSIYPCDLHGQRVKGPLSGMYLSVMLPEGWMNRRLRVCPTDLDQFLTDHATSMALIGDNGPTEIGFGCMHCNSAFRSQGDIRPILLYVYPKGNEPLEFYGNWCERCSRNLAMSMNLQPRPGIGPAAP